METKSTITTDVWKKILAPIDKLRMSKISQRRETVNLPKFITRTSAAIILMGEN
jgi:hypothetical protein